jgi:hypothetical protein
MSGPLLWAKSAVEAATMTTSIPMPDLVRISILYSMEDEAGENQDP